MKQFEMNFNEVNHLKSTLDAGQFFALLETSYGEALDAEKITQVHNLAKDIDKKDFFAGLAFLDYIKENNEIDPIDKFKHLKEYANKSPLVYFSGKGRSENEISERIADLSSAGALNYIAVSGDAYATEKETQKQRYVDSISTLKIAKKRQEKFSNGVVFNPFKYNANDSFAQYFKLVKKIRSGADFFVTQAGWDMKKLHETILFLKERELCIPAIARLRLIQTEDMPKLRKLAIYPGAPLSPEFCSMIEREFSAGELQFDAVQYKRLAMQIVGCKHMGFNGVQISGINTVQELNRLEEEIKQQEKELYSFHNWCQEWKNFHHAIPMCSPAHSFYMYSNLLNPGSKKDPQDHSSETLDFDKPSGAQLWKYKISSLLKVEEKNPLLQRLICGNKKQDFDLKASHYTALDQCPKKIYSGPCGGAAIDGTCEVSKKTCIHNEHLSIAAYFNDLDQLEDADEQNV